MPRRLLFLLLCLVLQVGMAAGVESSVSGQTLRVLVLDDAPPLSYRDRSGQLTGFNVEIVRALCREMQVRCLFDVTTQGAVVDAVAEGKADIAGVGLQETPERQGKLIFAKPHYRSLSLWLAPRGVQPGQPGLKVAVVGGSEQEYYARRQGWATLDVSTYGELGEPLIAGRAQAAVVPMISALNLQKSEAFRQLDLVPVVMRIPELAGDIAFGISPRRPELKEEINAALDRIKRNGTYDRINSRFLPFRVS
ncbi:MAG: amino acid ABC transporter substrate-binding protein [Azonexus sp.]|jgi:ABC-type amino acid transport substrate-binding protein|nr:amino acid ABC transporter substrate-binding protein [Azonexus sp.]